MELEAKKMKLSDEMNTTSVTTCKHYVKRKKRFCKMTVAKGREYCGEHCPPSKTSALTIEENNDNLMERIPCPLDTKHTVYKKNLRKHLRICNAKPKEQPKYITPGINTEESNDINEKIDHVENIKLSDLDEKTLNKLIEKIKNLYEKLIESNIDELILEHEIMNDELNNEKYGQDTRKHLIQTSSILGYLKHFDMLTDNTAFIEFGAGKGQVSFWLAHAINDKQKSKVILIDKASHRHKKDNKIDNRNLIHRIRTDIADFDIRNLNLIDECSNIVAVSKHLCGSATDLTLKCLLLKTEMIKCFIIALCCHHRCEWKSFVGKEFFIENNLTQQDFEIIIKMVSWAICGTGYSREKQKQTVTIYQEDNNLENNEIISGSRKLSRNEKEKIGFMCKRLIDYARLKFMEHNGFKCNLKYYVKNDITLENVCLIGFYEK